MDFFAWILIILLFSGSFIGLFYPIIPAILLVWIGVFVGHFFINDLIMSWWTWSSLLVITVAIFIADYIASMYFITKYGASLLGKRVATIGLIVGSFIIPPFGIFIVPFTAVFLIEYMQNHSMKQSGRIAAGTLLGFISSTIVKAFLHLLIIIIFLVDALLF
jgi:uncharacterized protein YqgC (DUF456 family)